MNIDKITTWLLEALAQIFALIREGNKATIFLLAALVLCMLRKEVIELALIVVLIFFIIKFAAR